MIKPRFVNQELLSYPIRIAVADGIYSIPKSHLASKFCLQSYAKKGDAKKNA